MCNSPTKPSFLAGVQYQGKGSILNNGRDRGSEKNERGKERLREKERLGEKWVFPFETGFMSVVCHCHVGWPEDRVLAVLAGEELHSRYSSHLSHLSHLEVYTSIDAIFFCGELKMKRTCTSSHRSIQPLRGGT